MKCLFYPLVSAAILVLSGATAAAQTTPPPRAPGAGSLSPGATSSPPVENLVDGPVKKVDPASRTVQVGGLFDTRSTTLAVTDDTYIAVGGVKGSLQDIQAGDTVKAAYEVREGKNIAKSIEVTHGEPAGSAGSLSAPSGSGISSVVISPIM